MVSRKTGLTFKETVDFLVLASRTAIQDDGAPLTVTKLRRACHRLDLPVKSEIPLTTRGVSFHTFKEVVEKGTVPPYAVWEHGHNDFGKNTPPAEDLNLGATHDDDDPTGEKAFNRLKDHAEHHLTNIHNSREQHLDLRHHDGPVGVLMSGDIHCGSQSVHYDRLQAVVQTIHDFHRLGVPLYWGHIGDVMDNMYWHSGEVQEQLGSVPDHIRAMGFFFKQVASVQRILGGVAGNHDKFGSMKTGYDIIDYLHAVIGDPYPYHHEELVLNSGGIYSQMLHHAAS